MKGTAPLTAAAALLAANSMTAPPSAAAIDPSAARSADDRSRRRRQRRIQDADLSPIADGATEDATTQTTSAQPPSPPVGRAEPTATDHYNKLAVQCPGRPPGDVLGYDSLSALRRDLEDYFVSFVPTASPTASLMPTAATRSPTSGPAGSPTPNPSHSPTVDPTNPPSEIPTKAPITWRPTNDPTGRLFIPKRPTMSPSPTVETKIHIGGDMGQSTTYLGLRKRVRGHDATWGARRLHELGSALGRYLQQIMGVGVMEDANSSQVVMEENGLIDEVQEGGMPLAGNGMTSYALEEEGWNSTLAGDTSSDGSSSNSSTSHNSSDNSTNNSSSDKNTNYNSTDNSTNHNNSDNSTNHRGSDNSTNHNNSDNSTNHNNSDNSTIYSSSDNNTNYNSTDNKPNHNNSDNSTIYSTIQHTISSVAELVIFHICPGSVFHFEEAGIVELPSLRIQTPLEYHPIELRCMDTVAGCVFRGGGVHLSIDRDYSYEDLHRIYGTGEAHGEFEEEPELGGTASTGHPITVTGITFREARRTSVEMKDPRGGVTFRNCRWEDNSGVAAISIDGTYVPPRPTTTTTTSTMTPLWCEPNCTTTTSSFDMSLVMAETSSTSYTFDKPAKPPSAGGEEEEKEEDLVSMDDLRALMDAVTGPTVYIAGDTEFFRDGEEYPAEYGGMTMMEEEETMITEGEGMAEEGWGETRSLVVVPEVDVPQSVVSIEGCSFRGNSGSATIVVSSFSNEPTPAEQDPDVLTVDDGTLDADPMLQEPKARPPTHSIHVAIKGTNFTSERASASIIENHGGMLQSFECVFANNTAESVVRSEEGTMEISATEFAANTAGSVIRSETGTVAISNTDFTTNTAGSIIRSEVGTVAVSDTDFTTNNVESVIRSEVGAVTISGTKFAANKAESIVLLEDGAEVILTTEAKANDVLGEGGLGVLDDDSMLERNEGACVAQSGEATRGASAENEESDSFVARQADVVPAGEAATVTAAVVAPNSAGGNRCEGIVSGGVCSSFEVCIPSFMPSKGENIKEEIASQESIQDEIAATTNSETNGENAEDEIAGPTNNETNGEYSEDNIETLANNRPETLESNEAAAPSANNIADVPTLIESPDAKEAELLKPIQPEVEDTITSRGCFSDWSDLVVAVRDRPGDQRDFVVCPTAMLIATSPVIIADSDHITIQCGTDEAPSEDCEISGGFSHFRIEGSSSGVRLARLRMVGSTVSSIMALGSPGATLDLRDCEWRRNLGASAIFIHENENLNDAGETLDIMSMVGTSGTAMSVDIARCRFEDNDFDFAAVANIGGTVFVNETMFANNAGLGGDIVVTSKGSCTVRESCFNSSASIKPGVIFIGEGSEMTDDENNFALDVSAGGYEGGTCTAVFREAEGADCLGSASCAGSCAEFSAAACALDPSLVIPPATPEVKAPVHGESDSSGSPNIAAIVAPTVISVFIMIGLAVFLVRRSKAKKPSAAHMEDAEESSWSDRFGFLKRKKKQESVSLVSNSTKSMSSTTRWTWSRLRNDSSR